MTPPPGVRLKRPLKKSWRVTAGPATTTCQPLGGHWPVAISYVTVLCAAERLGLPSGSWGELLHATFNMERHRHRKTRPACPCLTWLGGRGPSDVRISKFHQRSTLGRNMSEHAPPVQHADSEPPQGMGSSLGGPCSAAGNVASPDQQGSRTADGSTRPQLPAERSNGRGG